MNYYRNFRMIELIILIVILIILAILTVPMMFHAGEKAKKVSCSGNLKQCINALITYGVSNDNVICTSGNKYSGWYAQDGIPQLLGIKIDTNRSPLTARPVTLCPDIWINSPYRNPAQAYGAAWFTQRMDYSEEGCDVVTKFPTNQGQLVLLNKIPIPEDYVLLADSAYTSTEAPDIIPGLQCILFARQKAGAVSYFPRAISLRHEGEANVGYADGHVGNTSDRTQMLIKSKIGAYIDPTGRMPIVTQ